MLKKYLPRVMLPFLFFSFMVQANAVELSGYVGGEIRAFTEKIDTQASLSFVPELYWQTNSGNDSFTFKAFARADSLDSKRSHGDIRELMWLHAASNWELHVGIGKVYWGVTESAHLVDIINQTDLVESPDGEEKLGQPMVQWSGIYNWGVVDAFLLPFFRERTFPGVNGRLGGSVLVQESNAVYESDTEEMHTDWALRYSHSQGVWDYGLSYFKGTNRDPYFQYQINDNSAYLVPYYNQISQVGIDVQATIESWLWKVEAIAREDAIKDYAAVTAGFEYTLVGIADSVMDLGLLAEFHVDSRHNQAPTGLQKDLFIGARLGFNDVQDTSLLIGFSQDLDDSQSYLMFVEAARRLGENFRVSLDGRLFHSENELDPLYQVQADDHITLSVEYYY